MGGHPWWDNKAPKTPAILRAHARRRAMERYNVRLSKHHLRAIVQAIRTGKAEKLYKQSNNRSVWRVVLHDVVLYPIFDKKRRTVVTFLDEEMLAADGISVDKVAEPCENESSGTNVKGGNSGTIN